MSGKIVASRRSASMTLKLAIIAAAALAAPTIAHADVCSFAGKEGPSTNRTPIYDVEKVEYWSAPANFNTFAWRCDWDTGRCSLNGFIISKTKLSGGNQPTIIFEHGSSGGDGADIIPDVQSVEEYSCAIQRFVDAGYVVFYPYRRGVIDNTDPSFVPSGTPVKWTNSGWAAQDWAVWSVENEGVDMNNDHYTGQYITYLDMEIDDLVPGIETLINFKRKDMTTKLVDPSRIAIVGHSMGGALATFASTDDDLVTKFKFRPRGFISLSGAAMSYHGSHWWHDQLTLSATINNAPLFFTRVLDEDARVPNDFASAREPFAAIANFAQESGMALFSPVGATCANDTPYHCEHAAFVSRVDQIDRWFPSVKNFLAGVGM
jgi:pimeloyl-ACP methyl ester carboxylesterase